MKKTIKLNESQLRRIVSESVKRVLREYDNDEFTFGDSKDLGRGRHRQDIIYRGKPIGYLLNIEKNWLSPIEEKYILPDVDYGMDIPQDEIIDGQNYVNIKNPMKDTTTMPGKNSTTLEGKRGWIDFKVFDNYDEAFRYASQNFDELVYLFEYGDYD